jgi:hypothetical protein
MKLRRGFLLSTLVATSLAAVTFAVAVAPQTAHGADSSGGNGKKGGATAVPDTPAVTTLTPMLEGLKWGITHVEVTTAYNKIDGIFDREYNPLLLKTQPGVQMKALEADRDNRKGAFERSFLEFKDTPTGYDATGLKGEYTYKNHESIMFVDRGGK